MVDREGFGADGPDCGDPGEIGAGMPLVSQVEPLAGADDLLDVFAGLESEEGRIADEDGGVRLLQHGDGVGRCGKECGVGVEEFAEEDFGVGERAAGGGVGSDGFYGVEGMRGFRVPRLYDELDGADFVERGDGAARDDGERRRERGDGDEAEVGACGEKLVGAEGRLGVVEGVALGEIAGEGWMFEVPHEGSGIEEVDGGDAELVRW